MSINCINNQLAVSTPTSNLCGVGALGYLLTALGARANGNLITTIAGLTDQGISMYGLKEAAAHYGIGLTGLHVDAGQLKPQDLILLNINGQNHYAIYLGKIGDNTVLLDPYQGIVVLSSSDFNKYFTGNVLTLNPDGRGTTLTIDEMKGLFGGNPLAAAGLVFFGPPGWVVLGAIIIAGVGIAAYTYRDHIWGAYDYASKEMTARNSRAVMEMAEIYTMDPEKRALRQRTEMDQNWFLEQQAIIPPKKPLWDRALKEMSDVLSKGYKTVKDLRYVSVPESVSTSLKIAAGATATMLTVGLLSKTGAFKRTPVIGSRNVEDALKIPKFMSSAFKVANNAINGVKSSFKAKTVKVSKSAAKAAKPLVNAAKGFLNIFKR